MAALVQSIPPQQSSTVPPVLQSHPSSSPSTSNSSPSSRPPSMSWNPVNSGGSAGNYRGHQVVAPYAFTSTPNLANSASASSPSPSPAMSQSQSLPQNNRRSWSPHLSSDHRTSSAPTVPQNSSSSSASSSSRLASLSAAGSVSTPSSSNSSLHSHVSKDDSALFSSPGVPPRNGPAFRPLSSANTFAAPSSSPITSPKPSPDRYRRGNNRRADVAAGSQSTVPTMNPHATTPLTVPSVTVGDLSLPTSFSASSGRQSPPQKVSRNQGHGRCSSTDNSTGNEKHVPELAKRYRRRSLGTVDSASLLNLQLQTSSSGFSSHQIGGLGDAIPPEQTIAARRPSLHSPRESSGSSDSVRSNSEVHTSRLTKDVSSTNKGPVSDNAGPSSKSPPPPSQRQSPSQNPTPDHVSQQEQSLSDAGKKEKKQSTASSESPATRRLAAIGATEQKKQGKSRLRRAFSFGSASDIMKAPPDDEHHNKDAANVELSRREQLEVELGAEQAAIAEQQEAAGLGESIYSHQGPLFRSTDNLSVSSTASSASLMLRKMGKGMKKSTRSLVGLFRPKSVVNVPSADPSSSVGPMEPTLSVVNVEADKKTSNPRYSQQPDVLSRSVTTLPPIETHCLDSPRTAGLGRDGGAPNDKSHLRKSVVGGDRERAEVLAAVNGNRKGILKKANSDSAPSSPCIGLSEGSHSRNGSDSPHSSVPSTPVDQGSGRRTDNVRIAGEDYFTAGGRLNGSDGMGSSGSPPPGAKNIVFSPRIQFHETWTSGEYDRRADIATCNRLTPLLAQQIKEELNNFKLEMEVHEMSKVYTHFI